MQRKTSCQVRVSEYPYPTYISMGDGPSGSMSFTWHTSLQTKASLAECVRADDREGNLKDEFLLKREIPK